MMHLSELAAAAPGKPAVVMAGSGRVVTYRQLDERSRQVSRLLAELGIGTGGHLAVLMVNWHLTADEAGYIVGDSGARLVIAAPETAGMAARLAAQMPGLSVLVAGA